SDRCGQVGHVEQRYLCSLDLALRARRLPDPDQVGHVDRVEVCGVAAELHLAGDPGLCGVGQVERVERIDRVISHYITDWTGESHRINLVAEAESADLAHDDELRADLFEHIDR